MPWSRGHAASAVVMSIQKAMDGGGVHSPSDGSETSLLSLSRFLHPQLTLGGRRAAPRTGETTPTGVMCPADTGGTCKHRIFPTFHHVKA